MNLATRIGGSFRTEFGNPATQAYVIGSILALISGAIAWKSGGPDWLHAAVIELLRFFSPVLVIFPMVVIQDHFWKRFGLCLGIHALFPPLFFTLSHSTFLQLHDHAAVWIFLASGAAEIAILITAMRRIFPQPTDGPASENNS